MKNNKIFLAIIVLLMIIFQSCNNEAIKDKIKFPMKKQDDIFVSFHIAYFPSNLPIIDVNGPIYSIENGYYLGKIDIFENGKAKVYMVADKHEKIGSKYEKGYDLLSSLESINFKHKFCDNNKKITTSQNKDNLLLCLNKVFEFKIISTLRTIDPTVGEKYFKEKRVKSSNQELQKAIRFTSIEDWEKFEERFNK